MRGSTVAGLLLAQACLPTDSMHSLKVKSSGQVGCAPREIKIYDAQGDGMRRTWVAHCNGISYHCSLSTIAGYGHDAVSLEQDVHCTERRSREPEMTPVAAERKPPRPYGTPVERHVERALPTEALGYGFGISPGAALNRRC